MTNSPAISVILPVYNGEVYLQQAIQSVLEQSFRGFELIIINDGSMDNSEKIILSFSDPRIVYLKNESNSGLIFTLNRAISLSKGGYIARMDADDICLRERFEKQKEFLDKNPEIDVVGSLIRFIDENNQPGGQPVFDKETVSNKSIRDMLPNENCLSHPSIMTRTPILKEFQYKSYQKNIEDYDLWLRLQNHHKKMAKIPEVLLLYRIHGESITLAQLKKKNFFFAHFNMKRKFLWHEMISGRINSFTFGVLFAAILDIVKGTGKALKTFRK
jgi:glycosyltransferase involved in cell wall biosynthesis